MAIKKAQEFRDLSVEELQATLEDTRKKLFEIKNERTQAKQMEKPHRLEVLKKEIARMLTVLTEKHAAMQK